LLLFPLLYGVVLELIGRADLMTGAILGATHAAVELVVALGRPDRPTADARFRTFLARTLYGIVFGFIYIVPPPWLDHGKRMAAFSRPWQSPHATPRPARWAPRT